MTERERYFSFFGAVKTVLEDKGFMRWFNALTEKYLGELESSVDTNDYWRDIEYPALRATLDEIVQERKELLSQSEYRTVAKAWQWSSDAAVLAVWNDEAYWINVGLVKWPLEFVAPAAIAGSNCAPRYGLERAGAS